MSALTPFSALIAQLDRDGDVYQTELPADWLQGRTAYGGLTTALCYEAAIRSFSELPPLRSAQVTFIGPAMGRLTLNTKMLRQGRNVSFIEVDLLGDKGLATRCLLTFGASRVSKLTSPVIRPRRLDAPDTCPEFLGFDGAPAFTQHYDTRVIEGSRPGTNADKPDYLVWVKHKDARGLDSMAGLLALADMLPPAMLSTASSFVPISSMTWHMNVLVDQPPKQSAWCLLESAAESAIEGYSSQNMTLWDRSGQPLVIGRQSVAIFDT